MKVFLVAFLALTTIINAEQEIDAQRQQKIISASINLMTDIYNDLVAAPVNVLTSSLASMLVQVTAGIALNGLPSIGKRDVEVLSARIAQWANQLGQQIAQAIYPIINEQVMAGALVLTQVLGMVVEYFIKLHIQSEIIFYLFSFCL